MEVAAGAEDHKKVPAEVAAGAASVEVAAGEKTKRRSQRKWLLAASVEVAAECLSYQKSRPRGRWLAEYGSAPTDPEAPPMSVGQRPQQNEPTEAERIAQGWCNDSCVCGRGSCVCGRKRDHPLQSAAGPDEGYPILVVQCDYFFFNVVKEDIICKTLCAIVRRWSMRSKV